MITEQILGLSQLADVSLDFLTAVLILAGLTSIITQALFEVGLRYFINRLAVDRWFWQRTERERGYRSSLKGSSQFFFSSVVLAPIGIIVYLIGGYWKSEEEKRLVAMAGSGNRQTLYSLRFPQLAGLIGLALQTSLDAPRNADLNLLRTFGKGAETEISSIQSDPAKSDGPTENGTDRLSAYPEETRDHISHHLERGVDDLQVYVSGFWRNMDYLLSLSFSLGLVFLLVMIPSTFQPVQSPNFLFVSVGIAAGLIAPLLRNLLSRVLSLG